MMSDANPQATRPAPQPVDIEALAAQYPIACALDGDQGAGVVFVRLDRNPLPFTDSDLRFLAVAFSKRMSFMLLGKDRATVEAVAESLMFMARPAGGQA